MKAHELFLVKTRSLYLKTPKPILDVLGITNRLRPKAESAGKSKMEKFEGCV